MSIFGRTPRRLIASLLAAAALALLTATPALAHVPALESASTGGAPTAIGGPDISRATYGYLAPGEGADTYEFTVGTTVTRTIGIIVPAWSQHADFRPTLTLNATGAKPIEVKDPGLTPRKTEWEPFSLTTFWLGGERSFTFVPGVRYTLRVGPGAGAQSGRYVIVFGGPEQFDSADTLATLAELPVIWFGTYGGAPFHANLYGILVLAVIAGVIALIAWGIWRLATRSKRGSRTRSRMTPQEPAE